MSNVIEEFVIKFLTDSKEAKKGAQEIDKLLDGMGKKRHKKDLAAHEKYLKDKKKLEDKYNKRSYGRSSPNSPAATNGNLKLNAEQLVDRAIEARQKKELKREIDLLKIKENKLRKERKFSESMNKQVDMIHRTAGFKLADKMGKGDQYRSEIKRLVDEKDLEGLRKLRYQMTDVRQNMIRYRKEIRKTNIAQKGLTDSTRNMVRSYASLYAIFEGTTAIKRVGMDFQSMRASMLAASTDQEDAAKKLKFVEENAYRLGVNLREATRAYMQLSIAGKDVLSDNQIKELFVSTLEVSTALGMSIDDTKGTFRAFVQIDCLAV